MPLDTNKLETPSGDRRCRGLLLQDTQSSDVRGSFYWTPTDSAPPRVATTFGGSFHWTLGHRTWQHGCQRRSHSRMSDDSCGGWLAGWQARVFAWGTSRCTRSGPRHRSTNQLGRVVFQQREFCGLLGLSLAQQTFLATQKLGCPVAKLVR